ncbi:hypothetical protein GOODEAATRI_020948 [Goodea atripinnis]|uniref:Uncharacterized protein n=1 Tax=Goodea atripinnis TaxID=208336 RepID=A0ABV0NM08_9TELE
MLRKEAQPAAVHRAIDFTAVNNIFCSKQCFLLLFDILSQFIVCIVLLIACFNNHVCLSKKVYLCVQMGCACIKINKNENYNLLLSYIYEHVKLLKSMDNIFSCSTVVQTQLLNVCKPCTHLTDIDGHILIFICPVAQSEA